MKKSELKQIIKEEIQKILKENIVMNSSLEELKSAINSLPNTIKSLNVPIEVNSFNPRSKTVSPNISTWREDAIKMIEKAISSSTQDKGPFTFNLRTYTGNIKGNEAYYVQINSPMSDRFTQAMGSEKLGSLD